MQAVILAAGRGTRLHPITKNRTKAMCPVVGKPIVERVMDTLAANGIDQFILVIHPDDDEIQPYFEHQSTLQAQIQFVEQSQQLGMGHALLQAAPLIQDDFVLSSCDSLADKNVIQRMLKMWVGYPPPNGVLALLRAAPKDIPRMGIVEMEDEHGRILRIVEKPSLEEAPSNIGSVPTYMFSHKLIDYLSKIQPSPRGEYEIQDAIQTLIKRNGDVFGVMLRNRIDLTRPKDLLRLNLHYFQNGDYQKGINTKEISPSTEIMERTCIQASVTIGAHCTIGPNVFIESGAILEDGVKLENCVVLRGSQVQAGSQISNQVIW